jgi:hypothetical protein
VDRLAHPHHYIQKRDPQILVLGGCTRAAGALVLRIRGPGKLTDREWSGVWVSDRPLDNSEGASGEALLQIDIAEDLLTAFEWVEESKPYREWLVPAAVLNDAGTVRLLGEPAD